MSRWARNRNLADTGQRTDPSAAAPPTLQAAPITAPTGLRTRQLMVYPPAIRPVRGAIGTALIILTGFDVTGNNREQPGCFVRDGAGVRGASQDR